VRILGISFDSAAENLAFAEKFDYDFPLLCDVERKVGLAYGACKSEKDRYPARITYVVGPDGKIEQAIETKDPAGQASALLALMPKEK
jgi:peroxiredoxin Q/BCP